MTPDPETTRADNVRFVTRGELALIALTIAGGVALASWLTWFV